MRKTYLLLCLCAAALTAACGRDMYGDLFVRRETVTFRVLDDSGLPLQGIRLMTEELDAFDYDLIVDGTRYAYTDAERMVTVKAVFDEETGYSQLGERTTRFTFTASGHAEYDTIFNHWDGTVGITLYRN